MTTSTVEARRRWLAVVVFAIAMAWLEAATVYYLRVLSDRIVPYQQNPLPIGGTLGAVELVREAATLVMLLTVGSLAGRAWLTRAAYTAIAFGIWDILYYVFLRVMTDWPASLFDWDILFLLPLPWWGPVIAPMTIAFLMIVGGTLVVLRADRPVAVASTAWAASAVGTALALYVFMADAIRTAPQGVYALTQMLPTAFNWPLFTVAVVLMAIPVVQLATTNPTNRRDAASILATSWISAWRSARSGSGRASPPRLSRH